MTDNYVFKLYVVNTASASQKTIRHIKKILEKAGIKYSLEVIDVLENPELAVDAGIAATPTLVKEAPPPIKKIVGRLDDKSKILADLGIKTKD